LQTAITALNAGWEMTTLTTDVAKWAASELLPASGLGSLDSYSYVSIPGQPDDSFVIDYEMGQLSGASQWFSKPDSGRQNLVIKYTAGYATTPADLEQICIDLTKVYYDSTDTNSTLESEKIGDYAYKVGDIASGNMPESIQLRLSGYKRRPL
jgi:hypothetical protein